MKFKDYKNKILKDVVDNLIVQVDRLEVLQLELEELIDYINVNNEIININSDVMGIVNPIYRKIVDIRGFVEVLGETLKNTKN